LGPVLFLLFINDLPLSWKNRNGLFADDATFYASTTTLADVQVQLQRGLSNTATWTKDHGITAHPEKTKYTIIGTGSCPVVKNVPFRCGWMVGSWSKLEKNVFWD